MRKQWIWLSLLLITGCPKEQDTDVDNYTDTGVEDNDDETSNPCDGDTDEQTTDTTAEDGQERPQLSLNGTTVEASIVFTDPTEGTQFASAVGIVGDTSGNGCDDVLIGAQHAGTNEAGAAYFYEGSGALPSSRSTTEADTAFANGNDKDWAGFSVSGAGDINGDGYDDMLIGAPGHSNPENAGLERSGTVFIVHGSASASTSFDLKNANTTIGSSNLNDFAAGFSVSKAGDINGDGFDDVIIGQPYAGLASVTHRHTGQAFIMLGSSTGISDTDLYTDADMTLSGEYIWTKAGHSVDTAGDINGDGFDDVIIGAPGDREAITVGRAYIVLGANSGLSDMELSAADTMLWTSVRVERVGHSVSTAGDVNGDGYSDVVVGAPYGYRGAAYIFLGSSSGIATQDVSSADTIITGSNSVGYSVSSAGDFNDDGFDDVLVADPAYYSNEPDLEGNVYLMLGSSTGISTRTTNQADGTIVSTDGFGRSLSAAGDVNGDGNDDFIVGAPNSGRAYLFFGF